MSEKIGAYGILYDTPAKGSRPLGRISLDGFNYESNAVGGCWAADLSRSMSMQVAEDWYENGLAREIKFFDHEGEWFWEGFVNKITMNAGDISEVRGPLLDIANRVSVTYTPRDFSIYPPVDGSQTVTPATENIYSQGIYGIVEQMMSAGTCTDDTAIKVQEQFLAENAYPKTAGQISITPGGQQAPVVSIELLGKVHWMTRYIYDNSSDGISFLSDKIKSLLGYDPNSIISTDYTLIEDNLYLVNDLEDKLRFAWDILSELLTIGNDTDDDRRMFGIYENGIAKYNKKPTTIKYNYRLSGPQVITDYATGSMVRPWKVEPGNWVNVPDFLIGRNIFSTNLFGDPRNHFIESVKYSSPYTVDLSGGRIDRLSQMLAKISYSGGIY